VEFLILREVDVLLPLRSNLSLVRSVLAAKVSRVRALMDEIGVGATVSSLSHHWLEVKKGTENNENHENHENIVIESNNSSSLPTSSSVSVPDKKNDESISGGTKEGKEKDGKEEKGKEEKGKEEKGKEEKGKETKKDEGKEKEESKKDLKQEVRYDGRAEGEQRLFDLAFELYCALRPMQDSRRNRLLSGDATTATTAATTAVAYSNSSENCPSNNVRLLIESSSEKERKEIENKSSKITGKDNTTVVMSNRKTPSAYSIYGGVSIKDENKTKENESELLNFPTLEILFSSNRWGICGFQIGNPLKDFQSNGLLALKSLTEFLLRYEEAGCQLGADFAEQRSRFCTYAQVAVQLSKFTADALRLTPTPYTPLSAPIQHLAKQNSWLLLSEQNSFQELFNLSMLTFDEAWRAVTEERGTLPHIGTYEQCLLYVRETLDTIVKAVSQHM
jgi:ELMO/CED-12 family